MDSRQLNCCQVFFSRSPVVELVVLTALILTFSLKLLLCRLYMTSFHPFSAEGNAQPEEIDMLWELSKQVLELELVPSTWLQIVHEPIKI